MSPSVQIGLLLVIVIISSTSAVPVVVQNDELSTGLENEIDEKPPIIEKDSNSIDNDDYLDLNNFKNDRSNEINIDKIKDLFKPNYEESSDITTTTTMTKIATTENDQDAENSSNLEPIGGDTIVNQTIILIPDDPDNVIRNQLLDIIYSSIKSLPDLLVRRLSQIVSSSSESDEFELSTSDSDSDSDDDDDDSDDSDESSSSSSEEEQLEEYVRLIVYRFFQIPV